MNGTAPGRARRVTGAMVSVLALAAIAAATLRNGDPSVLEDHGHWCLVCGSQGTVDVIQNLVLFAPLGAGLALLGLAFPVALAVAVAASLTVESVQATVLVGRAATLSDVVMNTAGATVAFLATRTYDRWLLPHATWAPRLSVTWAAAWVVVCAAGAWGLLPAASTGPYRVQEIPPGSGHLREFEGTILDARVGNVTLDAGAAQVPSDGALSRELAADTVVARARVMPMEYAPGRLRPIVSVHDTAWAGDLILGQRRTDLVFGMRLNSSRMRLRTPSVRLADVFPGTTERSERRRAEIALEGHRSPGAVLMRSASSVESRERHLRITPILAWSTLAPFDLADSRRTWWMSFFWLGGWLFPLGYWGAGGWQRRSSGRQIATVTAVVALTAPWIAAAVTGVSRPSAGWLAIGAVLLLAGAGIGTFVSRYLKATS